MQTRFAAALLCLLASASAVIAAGKSSSFKTSDRINIHYVESGNGPALVFIPGWTMPGWIWQKQIDGFSERYRVIAVDPRSQGESDKPLYGHLPETRARDYKELVDHLHLEKPVLIGWSMGCGELMKYVEQFGTANLSGLVLVDGALWDKPSMELFSIMSGWMNALQQDRRKQADGFVRSMYRKPQPEEYLSRVVDASVQVPTDTAGLLIYNMIAVQDFSAAFAKLNVPMLFAYTPGMQQTADLLKAKLSDKVRLERFDGAGHALFVDDPEKFNRVLEEFVHPLVRSVP